MGGWTALWARQAGLTTLLADAWGAGNPRATSSDETRIIRSSHGADDFYPVWSRRARDHWLRFGQVWGEELLIETGALWFAHREDGFETASAATLTGLGIPVERLSAPEVADRWPAIGTVDLAFATFEPEGGLLMARRAVQAVARAFAVAGGRFEPTALRPGRVVGRRMVDVIATDGSRRVAGSFVFACGPWLPDLFPGLLGGLIRVTRQDVLFVGPAAGDRRFGADRLPVWVDYDRAFYGVPAVDGHGFKLAPDGDGPPFDPTDGERVIDPASITAIRPFLADRFPDLAGRPVVETRVCQYESTPDTHFIIDRHPELENVWIVGGGSGHGFKHSPRIGEYVVERLLGAPVGPGEERFSVTRPRGAPAGLRSAAATR